MTRSTSDTKALQSHSDRLQQSIFQLLARTVAPNCFRRQTFHVLNSDIGLTQLWSACLVLPPPPLPSGNIHIRIEIIH